MSKSLLHQEQFEMQHQRALREYRTFHSRMTTYLQEAHWNAMIFEWRTGLNTATFSKLHKEDASFEAITVVNVCIPLGLNYKSIMEMLELQSVALCPLKRHENAYLYLIEHCKGMDYRECNQVLAEIGVEKEYHFGSKTYNKK